MEIGFPIWRGSGGIKQTLHEILKHGFDFTEIDLETLKPNEIKNNTILKTGYHAPYTIPLSHPYLTNEARKHLTNLVKFASKTKAIYINIHMNHPTYHSLDKLNNSLRREAIKTIKHLRKTSGETVITLENPPRGDYWRCQSVKEIVEKTRTLICLDIGHIAYNLLKHRKDIGRITREIKRCLLANKEKIYLIHLHNVVEKEDKTGRIIQDHLLNGILDLHEIVDTILDTACRNILLEVFYKDVKKRETSIRDVARLAAAIRKTTKAQG